MSDNSHEQMAGIADTWFHERMAYCRAASTYGDIGPCGTLLYLTCSSAHVVHVVLVVETAHMYCNYLVVIVVLSMGVRIV